ncbi:MAG: D-glycerate dehydrogenase [Pseudomonadaceae bacterium]|nr:D-glycerate dehydrogenase [Pseudomonadaceae bacterium]
MTNPLKILVTRRWPETVKAKLTALGEVTLNEADQPLTGDELTQALQDYDVICPTVTDRLDAQVLQAEDVRTRLLANFGVGFNHIDLSATQRLGIAVTNTPGVLTAATAEITLTLMLMTARRAAEGERHVRSGRWQGWSPTHMLSTQVSGRVLGIVGMGRIGVAVARMAYHGLGMQIVYTSRSPLDEALARELKTSHLSLPELLAGSDFVSLHCPATPETRHLLNTETLALMQPHAFLINTARGDIVDETALVTALQQQQIAGAGLDVYEHEPQLQSGLDTLEQVVLLPHMGSGTRQTREAMGLRALDNIAAFAAGRSLPDEVKL